MFPISVKSFLIYPNRWWKTPESHLTLSSPSSPKAKPTPSPSVSYPKSRLHQTSLLPPPLPKATSPSSAFWATFLLLLLLLHLLQTNAHMATLSLTFCTRTDQNISNTLWHPGGVASVHFLQNWNYSQLNCSSSWLLLPAPHNHYSYLFISLFPLCLRLWYHYSISITVSSAFKNILFFFTFQI